MKTLAIPGASPAPSNIVLGLMRIGELANEDIRALYDAAREAGVNVFDHADIYGSSTPPVRGAASARRSSFRPPSASRS